MARPGRGVRRTTLVWTIALLALGPGARQSGAIQALQAPTGGTGAISGVVADAVTGRPVAGASVAIYAVEPGASRQPSFTRPPMLTDRRGRFVFVDLPVALRYTLIATRSGCTGGMYGADGRERGALMIPDRRIRLVDGEWMRDARILMWRPGSIGGRVVDEEGEPVVGAAVRAFTRRFVAGHELLVQGPLATTDDRGVYRLSSLAEGPFVVAVLSVQSTLPVAVADGPRTLPLGGLQGRGYLPLPTRPESRGASIDIDGRHRLVLTNFATPPPPGANRPRPRGSWPASAPGAYNRSVNFTLDRRAWAVTTFEEEAASNRALRYWQGRPAEERVAAVEFLRRQTGDAGARLRRVLRVVDRPRG